MSSISVGPARVMVVKARRDSMSAEAFANELEAVLGMISNGSLQRGNAPASWGSDEHKAALDKVERRIASVRAAIAASERRMAEADGCPNDA